MKLLSIMSHELLHKQKEEAKTKLCVQSIEELPIEFKKFWTNIPSTGDLPLKQLNELIEWIYKFSKEGDYILVQGEFGATFYIVDYCFRTKRIPIYATTDRVIKEYKFDDKVKVDRVFQYCQFRNYMRYNSKREKGGKDC